MQPLTLRGASARLLGQDPTVQALIRLGLPLTRANWLERAGLSEEEMTPELEAEVPEPFQLTEDGEQPPEVILVPLTPKEYAEHLAGEDLSED